MREFLRLLDRRYPWFGRFGEGYHFESKDWNAIMEEKHLAGTILEWPQ
jgi:hypothetical protein